MSDWKTDEFIPNWTSAPGETIQDILVERSITVEQFGKILDLDEAVAKELLVGNLEITETLAEKLAQSLGSTKAFWMKRESNYREDLIRLGKTK